MLRNLLENLRQRSEDQQLLIVFCVTLVAAIILAPIMVWSVRLESKYIKSQTAKSTLRLAEQDLPEINNPLDQASSALSETFSKPISVSDIKTTTDQTLIYFTVTNSSLADLTVPLSSITAQAIGDSTAAPVRPARVATADGRQFAPSVSAGQTTQGIIYLPKLFNGFYTIKFPELKYKDDNQPVFEQTVNIEVKDAAKPRS
ncbi:MAG TPA: hypothetical protein VEA37_01735 [Flavobacterium sp.]|nr:hypothetical protein [Flavobacterium sp.]